MEIRTGYGYYLKDGRKLHKYELPKGTHPNPIGYDFVEVNSKEDLDRIVLDKSQEQLEADTKRLQKEYHRNAAIEKLKYIGLLPEEINAIFNR